MNNKKKIFFVLALITLILAMSTLSATDDNNTVTSTPTQEADTIATHVADTPSSDVVTKAEKKQIKTDDETPASTGQTREVSVNNYDELVDAINNASNDTSISECTINLNEGTYTFKDLYAISPEGTLNENVTITINGNGQSIINNGYYYFQFKNKCNMIFNDVTIQSPIQSTNGSSFTFNNVTVTMIQMNTGNVTLNVNNSTVSQSTQYQGDSNISIINSTLKGFVGGSKANNNINMVDSTLTSYMYCYAANNNITIENSTINDYISFGANSNIKAINSTVKNYISTDANLKLDVINSTVNDYISFGANSNISVNNSSTKSIRSSGGYLSLDVYNSTINDYISTGSNSNITVDNSTLKGSSVFSLGNGCNINISNNSTLQGSMSVYSNLNNMNITINDTVISTSSSMQFNGNTLLGSGVAFVSSYCSIDNYGNLTITKDVDFSRASSVSLTNSGNLTLEDELILPNNTRLINRGELIINNSNVLYPFTSEYNGTNSLVNITIDKEIKNNGELTLTNVTIDNTINNVGKLVISDDTIFTENCVIKNRGEIEINDSERIAPYLVTYPNPNVKTFEIDNYDGLISTINTAVNDFDVSGENDSYIIKIKEEAEEISSTTASTLSSGKYKPKIIINANGKTISNTKTVTYSNNCTNTINQATIDHILFLGNSRGTQLANITLNEVTTNYEIRVYKNSYLTLNNSTINGKIDNRGTLIISDDTVFTSTASLANSGTILTNNTNLVYPFKNTFDNGKLENMTIDKDITIDGNFTLNNVTIDKTITNNGRIVLGENVTFTESGQIIGMGEVVTDNIEEIVPYIQTIWGNYTITGKVLDRQHYFNGNVTLDNCNITSTDNINFGILNINNGNIIVDDESTWIANYGLLIIDDNTNLTGNITNTRELYIGNLPEDYAYDTTYHVVNNYTAPLYFDANNGNVLTDLVNEGDTFDFQGTISGLSRITSLVIDKPVNIITSTGDGRIEDFSSITYSNGASGSNVTGLYTYNTQFYVKNAHNMVFDNISNVVNSKAVGWGVGQTSIRENSTNITVKNSYFYTKDNGGSSTFVLAWADNCTLYNSTIETDGRVGNLVYLTTYQVSIPGGVVPNSNNQILNNVIIGPTTPEAICWAIVLTGANNTIANNRIYYAGVGITNQWGSGIDGVMENETSQVTIENNTLTNNTHKKGKPQVEVTMPTPEITIGETTTITANLCIVDDIQTDINDGKVCFKVNGKVLRDETTGKVIYADIENGTATIDNVDTSNWNENTTLQLVYTGGTNLTTRTSEVINPTIKEPEENTPEFTVSYATATAGSEVTITVTTKNLDAGKLVLKVNGKTVKASDGKLYTKTTGNTTTFTYTVPKTLKAGDYTIKAVYTAGTDKLEAEGKLTVE